MKRTIGILLGVGVCLVFGRGPAALGATPASGEEPGSDAAAPGDVEVLGGRNTWRFLVAYRPYDESGPRTPVFKTGRWVRWGEELWSPLPGQDWADPDFDDTGWPRQPGPFLGGYGSGRRPGAALVYVRGRFGVTDPARATGLRLVVAYRGGVVVYLNGKEIARGHLPAGRIEPLTRAEDYPKEAFLAPDGQALLPAAGRGKPPPNLLDRYNLRIRRLAVDVPAAALKKGTNVLAMELHRAAVPAEMASLKGEMWDTVGLVGLRMTAPAPVGAAAVVPNVSPETGVHVWNAEPLLRVGVDVTGPDPLEPLGPIDLGAPINGIASGQVAVSAAEEIKGVSARAGDLKSAEGGTIRASAVRVRYAKPGEGYVALLDEPVDSAALQSVWVTVKVPPEARAGTYTGPLAVRGVGPGGGDVTVPIRLKVHGWKIGDPRAWRTVVNLLESPESVAGHYGVPLWSDRHFQLLEKSLALMGEAGNDVLGVSAVGKTVFGDDPLIVFRKVGPGAADWEPQFQFLDRYLALYQKHAGEPTFLCLQVWHYGMSFRGHGRDGAPTKDGKPEPSLADTIPIVELEGGQLRGVEMPMYGAPGTEKVWRQVMDGLAERVRGLSWRRECILLGTSGDNWPNEPIVAFFKAIAPWAGWRAITHGSGVPKWGATEEERTQPNGMVVRFLECARRISTSREAAPGCLISGNSRDCCGPDPFCYRSLAVCNVASANYGGFSWKGLDYWTYATPEGAQRSVLNYYVHFGNIVGGTPRTLAMPGPDGAVATVQFEMLREGTQDTEAVFLIRDALARADGRARVGDDLARRAQAAVDDLVSQLELGLRISPQGGCDMRRLTDRLHAAAAEVAKAVGAGG